MATFKILQSRLTTVDLQVDPSIEIIYILAKSLYSTFSGETEIADSDPKISYKPYGQGIFGGYLDNMTEALIEYYDEPDKTPRLKSFGKFTKEYINEKEEKIVSVKPPFDILFGILLNFHPKTKPVLWRILLAQSYIYNAIQSSYDKKKAIQRSYDTKKKNDKLQDTMETLKDFKPIRMMPEDKRTEFDWRNR